MLRAHLTDRRWNEVFELTASLLPNGSKFITRFRREVEALLGNDERLGPMLAWAAGKSASVQGEPVMVRYRYLSNELFRGDLLSNGARDATSRPDLDLDLDLDFILVNPRYRGDADLAEARDRAVIRARDLGLHELERDLQALSLPTKETAPAELRDFADKVRALMIKHRDMGHEWDLTKTQSERLGKYLGASSLLLSCLASADMLQADKIAMLESLFSPLAEPNPMREAADE